jgi:hypothetical protein
MKWQKTILLIVCLSPSVSVSIAGAAHVNEAASSHVAATKLKKLGSLAIDDLPSCKCSGLEIFF